MSSEHIDVELTTVNGKEKIEVRANCPDCGKMHFKFIAIEDLIIDED